MSLDRALSTGRFFRPGVSWFVKGLLADVQAKTPGELMASLDQYKERGDKVLRESDRLTDLDLDDETQAEEAFSRIKDNDRYPERWAAFVGALAELLREKIEAGAEGDRNRPSRPAARGRVGDARLHPAA
jgi:hypothetical protein